MNAKLNLKKNKDYYILCRSNADLPDAYTKKYTVAKEYPYNNSCVVVICNNEIPTDDARTLYVYHRDGNTIYKYKDAVYFEVTDNSYDLMNCVKGLHLTKYDVANFACKIKSKKDNIQNEAARYYGNPSDYFNSSWRPFR